MDRIFYEANFLAILGGEAGFKGLAPFWCGTA